MTRSIALIRTVRSASSTEGWGVHKEWRSTPRAISMSLRPMRGKRGIVMITPEREASLALAGHGIVGLAFTAGQGGGHFH